MGKCGQCTVDIVDMDRTQAKGVDDEGDLLNRNSTVESVARVIATQWFQSIYTNMSQRGVHLTWTPDSVIS